MKNIKSWQNYLTKSTTKFLLFCLITTCVVVTSCGTRISTIEKHSIETDSLSINNDISLIQYLKLSEIGSIKPFDPLKPMVIDGKYYFNVSIDFNKNLSSGLEIKAKDNLSYTRSDSVLKNKEIEKSDYTILWIGVAFIVVLGVVAYLKLPVIKI